MPRPTAFRLVVLTALGLVVVVAAVTGLAMLALYAVNPVGDEWMCSEGEAPAQHVQGGSGCFREGADLPPEYEWEPWGNRPMSYNCDKDGWTQIQRDGTDELDCVREGTDLPPAWHPVDDS